MKITEDEYSPLIKYKNEEKKYYAAFYDGKHELSIVEITKNIFLQMFGTHKTLVINNKKRFFIIYSDNHYQVSMEMNFEEYKNFRSFKSEIIREKHINSRYIKHSKQTEINIYKKIINKPQSIELQVYEKIRNNLLYQAINQLNELQKRRIIYYYIYEWSIEKIAKKENCSKTAVNYSIAIAKKNLKKILIKSIF